MRTRLALMHLRRFWKGFEEARAVANGEHMDGRRVSDDPINHPIIADDQFSQPALRKFGNPSSGFRKRFEPSDLGLDLSGESF